MMTAEQKNEDKRSDYHWYKDHGICVHCHKEMALKGHTRCAACEEIDRVSCREYRKKYVDAGVCWRCRVNPVEPGRQQCKTCADKRRAQTRAWRANKRETKHDGIG